MINLVEYIRKLTPDTSTLDMVEQYSVQNECSGQFKKIFFYDDQLYKDKNLTIFFFRGYFRYEGDGTISAIGTDNDFIDLGNKTFVVLSNSGNIDLKIGENINMIVGVAF